MSITIYILMILSTDKKRSPINIKKEQESKHMINRILFSKKMENILKGIMVITIFWKEILIKNSKIRRKIKKILKKQHYLKSYVLIQQLMKKQSVPYVIKFKMFITEEVLAPHSNLKNF